jgi:hypothetical protein
MVAMLLVGAIFLVGLAVGDEPEPGPGVWGRFAPNADDEPPVRLKRKKRAGEPPAPEKQPAKEKPKARDDEPPPAQEKDKEKAKDDEPPVPEDGRPVEEGDEKEVLERVERNMRDVEEKLGNREVGEPTAQQQRDILRDLDSLIKKSEQQQQQSGGGGGENQPQPQGGEQQEKGKQGGQQQQRMQQKRGGGGGGQMARRDGKRPRRELRSERGGKQRGDRQMAGNQPQPQPQQPRPGQGNQPGAGGQSPPSDREKPGDGTKDIWGHLPESLRAEMNAYSNPQPFLPRYDWLIREYYKTIAEQGRKKGD